MRRLTPSDSPPGSSPVKGGGGDGAASGRGGVSEGLWSSVRLGGEHAGLEKQRDVGDVVHPGNSDGLRSYVQTGPTVVGGVPSTGRYSHAPMPPRMSGSIGGLTTMGKSGTAVEGGVQIARRADSSAAVRSSGGGGGQTSELIDSLVRRYTEAQDFLTSLRQSR